MAADDPLCREPLVSVEFEVFGKVQGECCQLFVATYQGQRLIVLTACCSKLFKFQLFRSQFKFLQYLQGTNYETLNYTDRTRTQFSQISCQISSVPKHASAKRSTFLNHKSIQLVDILYIRTRSIYIVS